MDQSKRKSVMPRTKKKTEYDQNYYYRNREQILARLKTNRMKKKEEQSNVIKLFPDNSDQQEFTFTPKEPPTIPQEDSKKRKQIPWVLLLKVLLVTGITYFLIGESANFYRGHDQGTTSPYFKAILLEGTAITFSLMTSKSSFQRSIYKLMIFGIYFYVVWVLSGSLLQNANQGQTQFQKQNEMMQQLENQIASKQALQSQLLKLDRISQARAIEGALDSLQEKLFQLKSNSTQVLNSVSVWNNFLILVSFRIMMMLSNFLCLQQLGKDFKLMRRRS